MTKHRMAVKPSLWSPLLVVAAMANMALDQDPVPGCSAFEKDWDLPGGDYSVSQVGSTGCVVEGDCPCQKECDSDPKCHAWTLVPGVKCCLKDTIPTPTHRVGTGFFSGVKAQYKESCVKPAPPAPPPTPPVPPTPPPPAPPHVGPLACQDNEHHPMIPIFHIIGNVTQKDDGSIELEPINDCSGVTYYKGIYHVWHQCCQNHWDHVISNDLIHWQRLPPPIQPLNPASRTRNEDRQRTFDGSISLLDEQDGGPVILYDAPDRIPHGWPGCGECILSIARLNDTNDKYLKTFTRDPRGDPIQLSATNPIAFPSSIWRNGDHYNFLAKGARFTTKDKSFRSWTRVAPDMIGCDENGGQWWIPTPKQRDGSIAPSSTPNYLVFCGGPDSFRLGNYDPSNETFTWSGKSVRLEHGPTAWWGAQGGPMNNNRMMMIGWVPDWAGVTRLSALREVHWDVKTDSLVSNPLPELVGLRTKLLASQQIEMQDLDVNTFHVVPNTGGGTAASSDSIVTFSGFGSIQATSTFGVCVLANGTSGSGLGITITVSPGVIGAYVANIQSGSCQMKGVQNERGVDVELLDESEVTVRVLADRSVADWFVQGGRWAATDGWTGSVARRPADSNVLIWSSTRGLSAHVDVYQMGCGWLDPSYTDSPTMVTIDPDGKNVIDEGTGVKVMWV